MEQWGLLQTLKSLLSIDLCILRLDGNLTIGIFLFSASILPTDLHPSYRLSLKLLLNWKQGCLSMLLPLLQSVTNQLLSLNAFKVTVNDSEAATSGSRCFVWPLWPLCFHPQSLVTWLQWGTAQPSHACDRSTPTPTSELPPPPATWTRACRTSTSTKRVSGRECWENKAKEKEREGERKREREINKIKQKFRWICRRIEWRQRSRFTLPNERN